MKIIKIIILLSFIAPKLFGAELNMTVTGIDKFPIYDKVDEENNKLFERPFETLNSADEDEDDQ